MLHSGLHAVRLIIQGLGCVFQIIGFEVARYVALCLLTFFPSLGTSASQPEKLRKQSSLQTHMNEKWVLQNTIGLTDTRTKRSFVQFVQACRTSSFNYWIDLIDSDYCSLILHLLGARNHRIPFSGQNNLSSNKTLHAFFFNKNK